MRSFHGFDAIVFPCWWDVMPVQDSVKEFREKCRYHFNFRYICLYYVVHGQLPLFRLEQFLSKQHAVLY